MKNYLINLNVLILFLFFLSCDFTPRFHKRILDAQEFIKRQKYTEAIREYENIVRGEPQEIIKIKVYYQLGELYSTYLSEHIKALEYFNKVIKISSDPLWLVKAEERVGEINFTYTKNYKASVNSYNNLTKFIPKLEKMDFSESRLGASYFENNEIEQAIGVFNKIQKNTSHIYYVKSFYFLGMCNFETKRWQIAINIWKQYIKLEKRKDNIVQAKFLMANAYETMEKLKKAYDIYYSILGEYPNTEVIKNRLNTIYERKIARKR